MINISVSEDGAVQFGNLLSKPDRVRFFTKHRYPFFSPKGGSSLIMDFLNEVLDPSQIDAARDYAKAQEDKKLFFRHFYWKCGEFLGCTPKRALKLWNAAEFYTKLQPRLGLVDILARRRGGRVFEPAFTDLVRNEQLLKEVHDDGLKNILPLVFFYKRPPQVLKKGFGKSLWKRLANNSFHRNALLARMLSKEAVAPFNAETSVNFERHKDFLLMLEKIPSTLLANKNYMEFYLRYCDEKCFEFVSEKIAGTMPMKHVNSAVIGLMRSRANRIIDTYRMAEQLGEKFDIWKFTIDSFEIEHDRFTKMIQEKRYSPEPIGWLSDLEAKYFRVGRYEIELLDSRYKIHEEGKEMRHCVGSYADNVARGSYLVYSIKKDGKRISTLGLSKSHKSYSKIAAPVMTQEMIDNRELALSVEVKQLPIWDFGQHYGFANGRIEDRIQIFLGDLVISRLNGDDYVSDHDLSELEYYLDKYESQHEIMMPSDGFPLDRLKFNPYSPLSYNSPYDYRYKKVERNQRDDPRALMA